MSKQNNQSKKKKMLNKKKNTGVNHQTAEIK